MKGLAIIRVPPLNKNRDHSKRAIENIINLSKDTFNRVLVFETGFENDIVDTDPVHKNSSNNILINIFQNLFYQFNLSMAIWNNRTRLSVTLWHAGGFSLLLPIILSKLIGLKVIICIIGKPTEIYKDKTSYGNASKVFPPILYLIENISYFLSDKIVIFSENMKKYSTLNRFEDKLFVLRFNFENPPENLKPINERKNVITYLGFIGHSKGADKLADAVKLLYKNDVKIDKVYFVGYGYLEDDLKEKLADLSDLVEFTGWIPQEKVHEILSESKLFVLPSQSEGLPKALTEAMAHGVIPIVYPVGDIPDIVIDGETGFLLANTSPESIAEKIDEVLNHLELERVSERAKMLVEEEFTYETAVERYKRLLEKI